MSLKKYCKIKKTLFTSENFFCVHYPVHWFTGLRNSGRTFHMLISTTTVLVAPFAPQHYMLTYEVVNINDFI